MGYIGSNANCPSGCTAQTASPNNNVEADSMASIIFHELTETATDPHIDGWYRDDENQLSITHPLALLLLCAELLGSPSMQYFYADYF